MKLSEARLTSAVHSHSVAALRLQHAHQIKSNQIISYHFSVDIQLGHGHVFHLLAQALSGCNDPNALRHSNARMRSHELAISLLFMYHDLPTQHLSSQCLDGEVTDFNTFRITST